MDGMILREVRLFGHLADGIGDSIRLAFDTPARALRLLELNFPGFMQRFKEGYYFVSVVRPSGIERTLSEDHLHMGFSGDLVIMPAGIGAAGGKRKGILGAILGAVLIGAAFFFSGGALATALPGLLGSAGGTWASIAKLGAGLLLSSVSTLLTPTPNTDYGDVDEKRSFIFNGPTNLAEQGGVIPVILGTMMVGTTTVSASLDSEIVSGGAAMPAQAAKDSRHVLRSTSDSARLFYGDLCAIESTATLTKIDGVAVSGVGTRTLTAKNLSVEYDVSGSGTGVAGTGIIGFVLGTIYNLKRPVMQIKLLAGVTPNTINAARTVTFEFSSGGLLFTGTITIDVGNPTTRDPYVSPIHENPASGE